MMASDFSFHFLAALCTFWSRNFDVEFSI